MLKKYKWTLVAACILTLCPIIVGLVLWDRLPDRIPTHFGSNNEPNGWSSKAMAVFGLPLIMLGCELLCAFVTNADPKRRNINQKLMRVVLWIVPLISVITCLSCYAIALGIGVDIGMLINVIIGIVFIIIGNYMHKIKQNYTVGIKLPWTLNSEENWNRTHRVGSWLFILGGIAFLVNGYFKSEWVLVIFIAALLLIPVGYSYLLYKKGI